MLKSMTEQTTQVMQNKQLINELHPAILTAVRREKEALLMRRKVVEGEYNRYMGRVGNAPEQERVLTEIGRDRNVKQGVYVSLLQKREENAIELANTTDKGRKIDETLYLKKTRPKTLVALALALMAGLLLPYMVFFMHRFLKNRIDSEIDLKLLTRLPFIGSVSSNPDECEESFRRIRTHLLHQMKEGQKTVLVTSAEEGDGKSFCAIRLAEAFAKMGERTMLCDLNFHHPSIAKMLDVEDRTGLTTLLAHDVSKNQIQSVIKESRLSGLNVLPAGPLSSVHPADLLAHKCLNHLLDGLRQVYDIVILDSPAVGRYHDILIDGLADVTCYVCQSGKTTKISIEELDKMANQNSLASPCIVLNQK
jgi:capsular exopolysaccharide synthesis family protein